MAEVKLIEYSKTNLKPCPCCGSDKVHYVIDDFEYFSDAVGYFVQVKCDDCGLQSEREIQLIMVDKNNGTISLKNDVVRMITKAWNMRGGMPDVPD